MNATFPLANGGVHVDRAGLGSQPHGGQDGAHLLDLGEGDLVVSGHLIDTVLDLGTGVLGEPPMDGVSGLLTFIDGRLEVLGGA